MAAALARLDRLDAAATRADAPAHRLPAGARVAVVLVVGTLLTLLRIPLSRLDRVYAEDGMFLGTWLVGAPLFEPYAGYQHLAPRIVSGVVTLLPVAWWGLGVTIGSALLVGGVAAASYAACRRVVRTETGRLLVALVPVLAPAARAEVLGNLANVHWYGSYLLLWVAFVHVRRRWHVVAWGLLAFVCCMTEIQTALLAPLLGVQWLRRRLHPGVVAGAAAGLAWQVLTYLLEPRVTGATGLPGARTTLNGYLANVEIAGFVYSTGLVDQVVTRFTWWTPRLLLVALLGFALAMTWRRSWDYRLAVWAALAVSLGQWLLAYLSNDSSKFIYHSPPFILVRWGMSASLLLLAAVVLLVDRLQPTLLRLGTALLLVAVLSVSYAVVPEFREGPAWSAQVNAGTCTAGTVRVETLPAGWYVEVPCSRFGR